MIQNLEFSFKTYQVLAKTNLLDTQEEAGALGTKDIVAMAPSSWVKGACLLHGERHWVFQ